MHTVTSCPTNLLDIALVGWNMSEADRRELAFMRPGISPVLLLEKSVEDSMWTRTILDEDTGEPLGIFGQASIGLSDWGAPWMLTTGKLNKYARSFCSQAPNFVAKMHQSHRKLTNMVHVGNTCSLRWLASLGFTLHDPEPLFGSHFIRVTKVLHV